MKTRIVKLHFDVLEDAGRVDVVAHVATGPRTYARVSWILEAEQANALFDRIADVCPVEATNAEA